MKKTALILTLAALLTSSAHAATTLLDGDWKIQMYGFIEQDAFQDSTRSLGETIGNTGLAKPNTVAGDNGRMVFSNRNSRLGFLLNAPEQDGWKSRGQFEFDFLGYEPSTYSGPGTTPSEAQYWGFGAMRIRQANYNMEKDGWTYLVGQAWSIFGWQPFFVIPSASAPPVPGSLYQRTGQLTVMKNMAFDESNNMTAGLSLERPSQADSSQPNIAIGVKYNNTSIKSGYNSTYGDEKAEGLTVGISAESKKFTHSTLGGTDFAKTSTTASAVAVDVLIPIIPSSDGKVSNTLSLFGEYSQGTGYADALPSWTGGFTGMSAAANTNYTNVDAGFAGFDNGGNFTLMKLQTWNANLQYHFSEDSHAWVTLGVSHMHSSNAASLSQLSTTVAPVNGYFADNYKYINWYHDVTKQVRVALEYGQLRTSYTAGLVQDDSRYQFTGLFRF